MKNIYYVTNFILWKFYDENKLVKGGPIRDSFIHCMGDSHGWFFFLKSLEKWLFTALFGGGDVNQLHICQTNQ